MTLSAYIVVTATMNCSIVDTIMIVSMFSLSTVSLLLTFKTNPGFITTDIIE